MKTLALTLTMLLSLSAFSQQLRLASDLVDHTVTSGAFHAVASIALPSAPDVAAATPNAFLVAATPAMIRPKVVDRTFVLVTGMSAAAMVLDTELTVHCLQKGTCTELNPLLGSSPSRARLYATNVPMMLGGVMVSRWLKSRNPNSKLWMLIPFSDTASHGIGAATGLKHY